MVLMNRYKLQGEHISQWITASLNSNTTSLAKILFLYMCVNELASNHIRAGVIKLVSKHLDRTDVPNQSKAGCVTYLLQVAFDVALKKIYHRFSNQRYFCSLAPQTLSTAITTHPSYIAQVHHVYTCTVEKSKSLPQNS